MDMFIEGSKDFNINKHYIAVKNYPLPLKSKKGFIVKRFTMLIDITDLNFDSEGEIDFESWCNSQSLSGLLSVSSWAYGSQLIAELNLQDKCTDALELEIDNWTKAISKQPTVWYA